ncbi:MAG: hypothetical protein QXO99_07030 [Candidatus Methanomethylicia archaeon]
MLFDERPKENRRDLYDRERELEELKKAMGKPIILLTGMRRIGKTSVLKVFLNECGMPYSIIDVRGPIKSYKSLYSMFSNVITQLNSKFYKGILSNLLKHINGVRIFDLKYHYHGI